VAPTWKARARQLKLEVYALYYASRDPRVPWYAKALAGCLVAYAFSPIDLIPDMVPVLGYLDDLVLIPLGVLAVRRMIPPLVLDDCRARASDLMAAGKPTNWKAAVAIVAIWIVTAIVVGRWLLDLLTR
jgi:uncharacterized membrane protein YkvA (DUF1232 family)